MSLRSRLRTTISVTTYVEDDTLSGDRYGSPYQTPTITDYLGAAHEVQSEETLDNRETESSTWVVILPPEAVVSGTSLLSWTDASGNVYTATVIGKPTIGENTRGPHHVEVHARTFEG